MKRSYLRGARFKLSELPGDVERVPIELIAEDGALARGTLYRPHRTRPRVGALMMHPRMDQSQSYILAPFIAAGYAALGCGSRAVHNDSNAIQERLLLDVAAAVRVLRESGCEQVVLVGNSGGAGLLTFYQSQARTPPSLRLTHTPAGDPCDLGSYQLPAADGLVLIAGHPGEGSRLFRWLDASVTDEDDPLSIDRSLDMYDPDNGFRVPPEPSHYSDEFLTRFQAAQQARGRRIEGRARQRLAARAEAEQEIAALDPDTRAGARGRDLLRRATVPQHLLIPRMLACPEWLDLSIEPDDRDVGSFNNDPRPDLQNYEESLATFLTPEAFLSTWSGLSSRMDLFQCLPAIPDPLLVVHYRGDAATRLGEVNRFVEVSGSSDKQLVVIPGIDHWGYRITGPHQRGDRTSEGTDEVVRWTKSRFPLA